MAIETFFRRRISKGIRRFLFCGLIASFSLAAIAAEKLPATIEGRMNRNAFPLARHADRFAPLPPGAETALRARIEPVLEPIRLAPAAWFRSVFGTAPGAGDRKRILESLRETEIWKCLGETCRGCPASAPGCVLAQKTSGGTGVVGVIHACLLGEGKCRVGMTADVDAWAERFITEVAFHKLGLARNSAGAEAALKKSASWIQSTSGAVNGLLGACPGPFSSAGKKFLREVDALIRPNAALKKCGEKYLETLRKRPPACGKIFGKIVAEVEILRCDSFCAKMLCRTSASRTVWTEFGGNRSILLLDGACEGETPMDPGAFLREATPLSLRTQAEAMGCLLNK